MEFSVSKGKGLVIVELIKVLKDMDGEDVNNFTSKNVLQYTSKQRYMRTPAKIKRKHNYVNVTCGSVNVFAYEPKKENPFRSNSIVNRQNL